VDLGENLVVVDVSNGSPADLARISTGVYRLFCGRPSVYVAIRGNDTWEIIAAACAAMSIKFRSSYAMERQREGFNNSDIYHVRPNLGQRIGVIFSSVEGSTSITAIRDLGPATVNQLYCMLVSRSPSQVKLSEDVHAKLSHINLALDLIIRYMGSQQTSDPLADSRYGYYSGVSKFFTDLCGWTQSATIGGYHVYDFPPPAPDPSPVLAPSPIPVPAPTPTPAPNPPAQPKKDSLLHIVTSRFNIQDSEILILAQFGLRISKEQFRKELARIAPSWMRAKCMDTVSDGIWKRNWSYITLKGYLEGQEAMQPQNLTRAAYNPQ
jgi:hypothetical protein